MNRIYQGRVSGVEISADGRGAFLPLDSDAKAARALGEQILWSHHELFQDAVNYYVVCLLALAQPGNALYPIREKLDAKNAAGHDDERMVWRSFLRRGILRRGLRDSVVPYLCPGRKEASPGDCFAAVLAGNECAQSEDGRKQLDAGLAQLLAKCTGESGCRNSAKEYLPRFASPDYGGSYGADSTTLLRGNQSARFPFVLHDAATTPESPALDEFGVHSIALPNEKKPKFVGTEAVKKLRGMIDDWSERLPEASVDWARLTAAVTRLPETFEMPGYAQTSAKNEVKFRLFAMFLFRYVERSEFTLGLLRATTRIPAEGETVPAVLNADGQGGDPIRLARGARGYVFRAFTSLACWGGDEKGAPQWVQFDFAAFGEALKALHQVDAKSVERARERKRRISQLEYQRQFDAETHQPARKVWKGDGDGEEGTRPPVLAGDPRIERLEALLTGDVADEYSMAEGVSLKSGLQPRTLRAFREIRKRWNDALGDKEGYSEAARTRLLDLLNDYKDENAQTIGSSVLFDVFVCAENWLIWREPTGEQLRQWRQAARWPEDAEFARDPLQALMDERDLLEEIKGLEGPIRFTPADAEHSPRQFYFSDVTALDKRGRLRHDRQVLEAEIGVQTGGRWVRSWARITFSAPRLLRDQVNNSTGAEASWQQAMMIALGLKTGLQKNGAPASFADCAAVALMPEVVEDGRKRILLNFPLELDELEIPRQLAQLRGRAAQFRTRKVRDQVVFDSYWERQMVAAYKDKKLDAMFHLRWPSSSGDVKPGDHGWWWEKECGFSCLAVDLGQREAGAYALLEACSDKAPKPQSRRLGEANGKTWWATVRATGMLRLPGEDARVVRNGQWQEEFSGSRGRLASHEEWDEAREICGRLGFVAEDILGRDPRRYSFPELNDLLLFALRRAQARLARFQSWSAIAHESTQPPRRHHIAEQIREAEGDPHGLKPLVAKQQWVCVTGVICRVIEREREVLKAELVRIADRVQPLRGRRWEWVKRDDGTGCHFLRQTNRGSDDRAKLLAGQRGLSMKRIEQLESLRQRCQSLNLALMQTPGAPARWRRRGEGVELPDPCPALLDRIETLRQQRVNQAAHLILAQALGVRLKPHEKDPASRAAEDIHGEYERIPGREPVDFLVLESMDRYLASQGRSRGENSRLMKWSHRAIIGKLKQLCEPYGLRVLETPAAYSSRFCSLTGVAGFHAVEVNPDDREDLRWKKHLDRLAHPERFAKLSKSEREESRAVKRLFDDLLAWNRDLMAERDNVRGEGRHSRPKWRTLLAPAVGGPIFVPMRGKAMPAAINAAINLGLRAIASPEADDIHLRIRAARRGDAFVVRAENAREKTRWKSGAPAITIKDPDSRQGLLAATRANFFFDPGGVAAADRAAIDGEPARVAAGRGLWRAVNNGEWNRVEELNNARLGRHARPPQGHRLSPATVGNAVLDLDRIR